jgi:hypothetical protein
MNKELILKDLELFVNDMKLHGRGKGKYHYSTEYPHLYNFNKDIFNKVYECGVDTPLDLVKEMINMKFNLDNGTIKQYDADVIIGQKCFDHYIAPKLI